MGNARSGRAFAVASAARKFLFGVPAALNFDLCQVARHPDGIGCAERA